MKPLAMRRYHILAALLIATFTFALWSWNRPVTSASNLRLPKIAPGQSITYNGQTFAPVYLRLVDTHTEQPISGANVHILCLGGTPFGAQTNRTNTRGYFEAVTYKSASFIPLRIEVPGFHTANFAANISNNIVKLSLKSL